ncbi:DUF4097 family beta strand repeat-containing protein [Synoicihabitans lomoniglobus]|uniref:DUF4097 family beta strand repeat-containing protein n=1 Tax=Synoicihabitans lomoniglobus TaxID=2909285 RepID=A0AAF0I3Y5_9BACT|nr:DUF4097 family beta strand repeat-containing protein [Opitutaceae bacterium LMO-M01]WED66553.1 DUF4097 family beta strand repeat-containing protein [Opitutaceae bacterium LMO-M01]
MKTKIIPLLMLALACASTVHADWFSRTKYREPIHREGAFNADGILTIENVNGKVTIEAWDRNAYVIEGEKRAKDEDDLDRIDIKWSLDDDHIGIKVKLPKKKGFFSMGTIDGRVDLVIKVPASAHVRDVQTVNGALKITGMTGRVNASTVNGSIDATNLGGSAKIHTVNGGVRAHFAQLNPDANIEFNTVNGGVKIYLPEGAGATLKASVVNGHIETDMPVMMQGRVGKKSLNGTIGDGGAIIEANTVNGSIKFAQSDR